MSNEWGPQEPTVVRWRYMAFHNQRAADAWRTDPVDYGWDPTPDIVAHQQKAHRFEIRARLLEGTISPDVAALALRLSHDWQGSTAQLIETAEQVAE